MQKTDGMNYAPEGKPSPVCTPGDFPFAAVALDHGHITGMCRGLTEAGGELRYVFDPDSEKVDAFRQSFPSAQRLRSLDEVLDNDTIKLVAAAAVPSERGPLGVRVLEAGKDYFTDKAPFTSLDHLAAARVTTARTGRKYMAYYSERLHVEAAVFAGQLIEQGAIGRVVQVIGLGPHRLNAKARPPWFFERARYGGILCDLASHQIEQFLHYTGAKDAEVIHAAVANYGAKEYPELEDFGEANLVADNGAAHYLRVDWLTPEGLRAWGDGRTFILGTGGYIELRKYLDVARGLEGDRLFLVDGQGEQEMLLHGKVGFPFFGQLIRDCLDRTETAMTQEHVFKAAELSLVAQKMARRLD